LRAIIQGYRHQRPTGTKEGDNPPISDIWAVVGPQVGEGEVFREEGQSLVANQGVVTQIDRLKGGALCHYETNPIICNRGVGDRES